ncbi:MAG: ATP-binding protein [candidate division WOR-3 bacterium]|nr:ATP-binding protein [candidate division WOR-3 bacterium]
MNRQILKQIIKEGQEFKFPLIYPREITIPLDTTKIITVTGPRRSGKTYLLFSLMQNLLASRVRRERILYINFDDPRILPFDAMGLEDIWEAYFELYPELKAATNFLFFDEIQNVKDWEVGIRRIFDTRNFKIFLTGSSSKFLSKEIATTLRGRAINFELLPFSFSEILAARGIKLEPDTVYSTARFRIKKILAEFFELGGFPEIVLAKKDLKIRILQEYIETMFFRDLIERYRIKNQPVLRELMKYLTSNISNLFSLNAFWQWIKPTYPVGKRTLIEYVSYLEDIGVFFFIRKFSFSLKEQVQRPRKVYIVDNGLRTVYGFKFSQDLGRILKNVVFLKLKKAQTKNPLLEIFYWQDSQKREVDFVVKDGTRIKSLIQTCAEPERLETQKREIVPLIKAAKELKCHNLIVITLDKESEEKVEKRKLVFKPLWKWLLE